MENVKSFLTRIRKQDKSTPRHIQILVSIGIVMAGFALGVLQKWLDSGAVNELPDTTCIAIMYWASCQGHI